MNEIFFKKVPKIGSLYLEETLFSYENTPILFVCIDTSNKRYFCMCDDIIDEESWIIVPISNETLMKVINDEITVLSAFRDKKIIIANRSFEDHIRYNTEEYNKIDPDELPVCDQYLEMKEYLSDYVNKINNSSFTDPLFSSTFICKYDFNDFLQYILDIDISYSQLQQKNADTNSQPVKEALNLNNDFSFKIEYEEDKDAELKEWLMSDIIRYAA